MVRVKRERSASSEDKSQVLVDRISFLPTDVLGWILSFLTFKQATATCIISHRWKYLWTLIPNLHLDGEAVVPEEERSTSGLSTERSHYAEWVDGIIHGHRTSPLGSNLDEFRLIFHLYARHTERVDEWLDYALSRKVQRLEMNFLNYYASYEQYTFPYGEGNLPENFKMPKTLTLHSVDVSGEALEFFIKNCRLLEELSVTLSNVLSSLEIIRPSPSFKCLEIGLCYKLESVVIRDSYISTIKYIGFWVNFELTNVPHLTELWIGGPVTTIFNDVVDMFSFVFPQLEMLKICLIEHLEEKETRSFASAVEMCNLKQLVVILWGSYSREDSILPVIYLISAAPRLQRFVLEASRGCIKEDSQNRSCHGDELCKLIPRAYAHLKEVEIVGYGGMRCQFELIKHFVEKDCALETLIIDPQCFGIILPHLWLRTSIDTIEEEIISARAHAQNQLRKYIPSRINLVIL